MNKEKCLPISWEGWDEVGDVGDIFFYKVTFLESFGEIQKDSKFSSVFLSLRNAMIICYDEKGLQELHTINFKLIPE